MEPAIQVMEGTPRCLRVSQGPTHPHPHRGPPSPQGHGLPHWPRVVPRTLTQLVLGGSWAVTFRRESQGVLLRAPASSPPGATTLHLRRRWPEGQSGTERSTAPPLRGSDNRAQWAAQLCCPGPGLAWSPGRPARQARRRLHILRITSLWAFRRLRSFSFSFRVRKSFFLRASKSKRA